MTLAGPSRRHLGRTILVGLLCALPALAGRGEEPLTPDQVLTRLAQSEGNALQRAQVLTATGSAAIAPAVALLLGTEGPGCEVEDQNALLLYLRESDHAEVVGLLPGASELRGPARGAALRILRQVGDARHVGRLVRLATPEATTNPLEAFQLGEELRMSLRDILRRDPASLATLTRSVSDAPARLRPVMVVATEALPVEARAEFLADLLGRGLCSDSLLLGELVRCLQSRPAAPWPELANTLRPLLQAFDDDHVNQAALALGHLQDPDCASTLVQLLDHPGTGARALAGLRSLSGLDLPHDSRRWRVWLHEEEKWAVRELPSLVSDLRGPGAAQVAAAVQEIARHRLRRHEQAAALVQVLERREPHLRLLAVRALSELRSGVATQPLTRLLERAEPELAEAVRDALYQITGRHHSHPGPEPAGSPIHR